MFLLRGGPVFDALRAWQQTANARPENAFQSDPRNQSRGKVGTTRRIAPPAAPSGGSDSRRITRNPSQLYRRWVIEHYDDLVDIIVRDGASLNGNLERTLPHIANALIQHDKGRAGSTDHPGRAVRSARGSSIAPVTKW